jgi:lysophospholipase L1-like esterase
VRPSRRKLAVLAAAGASVLLLPSVGEVTPRAHADRPGTAAADQVRPDPLLAELYDSTAITAGAAGTGKVALTGGDLDGRGHTLPASALARAGWAPGARLQVNGLRFVWPGSAPGTPDNVIAAGQRIRVAGSGTALGFLTVATGADGRGVAGTGTIAYTDGSTQRYRLSVPDWRSAGGRGAALRLPYLNTGSGPDHASRPRIFVREVPLRPGKRIRSVTLPTVAAGTGGAAPALHVFSVGLRPGSGRWTGTWASAQHSSYTVSGWSERSVRIPVRTTVGGSAVRIRLSNVFGSAPLRVGQATVALGVEGATVAPDTLRRLTFAGRRQVTVPAGAEVLSDPVRLAVPALADLAVSLYLPGRITHVDRHWMALRTVYWTPSGARDHTADPDGQAFTRTTASWPFLSAVDVVPDGDAAGAIVALGDSVTDGAWSTPDTDFRWTDQLAERLADRPGGLAAGPAPGVGVLNAGISGNRVNRSMLSNPAALDRLDRDVFAQSGVRTVIVFEGVNDVNNGASAEAVIAGLTEIASRARGHGLRVVGGTVIPFRGWAPGTEDRWTPAKEAVRQRVNAFIRDSGGVFDAVVDFDAALRDPDRPDRYLPDFDSGDHLHPNDAGMTALAEAVDLDRLGIR